MLNEFICFEYQILTVIGVRNVRYYRCGVDRGKEIRKRDIRRHNKQWGRRKVVVILIHVDCRGLECLDFIDSICVSCKRGLQKMHCKESPVFAVVTFCDKEGDCVS